MERKELLDFISLTVDKKITFVKPLLKYDNFNIIKRDMNLNVFFWGIIKDLEIKLEHYIKLYFIAIF